MKLQILSFAVALPALVAAESYPCVYGFTKPGFEGDGVEVCTVQPSRCLDFRNTGEENILMHKLRSIKTTTSTGDGEAGGYLFMTHDCTGDAYYVDADGLVDVTNYPGFKSFNGWMM